MTPPSDIPSDGQPVSPTRQRFLQRLVALSIKPTTHEYYVHWVVRFTRFCLECLKQTPQNAGTAALTTYLNYLALERNVSAATQKQAPNAMVFLTRKVFRIEDFTIETPSHGHTYRRPPVVLSRREITAVLAHLEDPWKLAAQLMYGSGLRVIECMRLRVKDIDFDQGTITVHDGIHAAAVQGRHPQDRHLQACQLPQYAPFVRD